MWRETMTDTSTILIVDDEPLGRETLASLLRGQRYLLVFAREGAEALAQAAALPPDLILLDVMMPGMDGLEVCRRLRADSRLAEVPIILVTALDDRDSRLRGIEAGADDFVTKPFDRIELRARVRTTTRLNRDRRSLSRTGAQTVSLRTARCVRGLAGTTHTDRISAAVSGAARIGACRSVLAPGGPAADGRRVK